MNRKEMIADLFRASVRWLSRNHNAGKGMGGRGRGWTGAWQGLDRD